MKQRWWVWGIPYASRQDRRSGRPGRRKLFGTTITRTSLATKRRLSNAQSPPTSRSRRFPCVTGPDNGLSPPIRFYSPRRSTRRVAGSVPMSCRLPIARSRMSFAHRRRTSATARLSRPAQLTKMSTRVQSSSIVTNRASFMPRCRGGWSVSMAIRPMKDHSQRLVGVGTPV